MSYGARRVAEPDGGRHVVHRVGVDQDLDVWADRLADPLDHGDAPVLDLPLDLAIGVGRVLTEHRRAAGRDERIGLDRHRSPPDLANGVLDHLLDRLGVQEMGVERDVFADLAAEQLVDWHAERLSLDVPAGDVHAGDHRRDRAARTEVGVRPEHLVPERLDLGRVLALEQPVELAQGGGDGAVGDSARVGGDLAPAGKALVRLDLDEDVRCSARIAFWVFAAGFFWWPLDDPGSNAGDLHGKPRFGPLSQPPPL